MHSVYVYMYIYMCIYIHIYILQIVLSYKGALRLNIGALIFTYTILGVPRYKYNQNWQKPLF